MSWMPHAAKKRLTGNWSSTNAYMVQAWHLLDVHSSKTSTACGLVSGIFIIILLFTSLCCFVYSIFFRDVWGMDKGGVRINKGCDLVHWVLGPHLLTPINFNANMDMELQPLSSVGWNYLSIPKLDATVQVLEWINNFIPHLPGHVITYPCWD